MMAEFKGDELDGSLFRNIGLASFARQGDTLVVAYEGRIFALDLPTRRILWRMNPDTFPHRAQPVVHDGTVFLTVGPKRKRAKN